MLIVIARTILLYGTVILVIRIMGKRQVGELQPFELAITIMISALAAIPMEDIDIPLLFSIIPIFLLLAFQVIISIISMRSTKARSFLCGKPTILIKNGRIIEDNLKKLRINLNDLLEQLRIKGYYNIADIEFAIMETTGKISVIPKSQKRPLTPDDLNIPTDYEGISQSLIIDGEVQHKNLAKIGLNEKWLLNELKKFNIYNLNQIFFAAIDSKGNLLYQLKIG